MIRSFDKDTSSIENRLAERNLQSEKRRNIMVIISVALAAFLICVGGGLAVSLVQMQNNQVADTYEAVYSHVAAKDIQTIKKEPGVSRVGEYYLIGQELSKNGFTGSFIYADDAMLYTGRQQMNLLKGKTPEQINETIVSETWLKKYYPDAKIGDGVLLETDSFQDEYIISGIMDNLTVGGSDTYGFIISKKWLMQYSGYKPSEYRAYVHLKYDREMSQEEIEVFCEAIAEKYRLPSPSYNSQYFSWVSESPDFETILMTGLLAAIVLIGGCIVIQSIFRISITSKVQSFGQLRTLGATKKQITRMVYNESHRLGWIGVAIGILLGIIIPVSLMPDSFNIKGYTSVIVATILICRIMIRVSIKSPVKIAANISPVEAVRFVSEHKSPSHSRCSHKKTQTLDTWKNEFQP